ncbi:MAG: hypothetical protein R3302_08115 [Sulfurimonadaceae bacterium]|nr:hypothetical protein [Sulfurimonadaceae bacterium]
MLLTEWLIIGAIALFAIPGVLFYLYQHRLVFAPNYYPNRSLFVEYSHCYHLQTIEVSDGVTLEGVVYEPEEKASATVLYFGGKEQDSVVLIGKFSLHYPAVRFVAFNYRGYGVSGGKPSHKTIFDDAEKIYDWAHKTYGDTGVLGYSLGTSVAAYLGAKKRPRWVVLVSAFSSVERLIKERIVAVPRFLVRGKYDTLTQVKEMVTPLYLFASRDDKVVPFAHTLELKAAARHLAGFKEFSGYNHADLLFSEELENELTKVFSK